MVNKLLGFYWKWRIYKNQCILKDLIKLKEDCFGHLDLIDDVETQIWQAKHLISQAELQLLKYKASIA